MSETEEQRPESGDAAEPAETSANERLQRRVVTDAGVRRSLRERYDDACQVCGRKTKLAPRETYAEVHALASAADDEPEDVKESQCVVLCPEHHALFDAGAMAIHPDEFTVYCANRSDRFHGRALAHDVHGFSAEALRDAWKLRVEPPEGDQDGTPRLRTIDAFLEFLFEAAVDPEEEEAFERYMTLVPGGRDLAAAGRQTHRNFAWAQLRRRAGTYLVENDPTSFHVVQTRPEVIDDGTEKVRVMLACRGRNPAPITLERDDEGAWWLGFMGL